MRIKPVQATSWRRCRAFHTAVDHRSHLAPASHALPPGWCRYGEMAASLIIHDEETQKEAALAPELAAFH